MRHCALKPALGVATRVDQVRVLERELVRAEQNVVHCLDTNAERMILIRDLVLFP